MGKYFYFGNSKQPYELKPCAHCGEEQFILKQGKYCSITCAARARKPKPKWFHGTMAEYKRFHKRVYSSRGKASQCVHCERPNLTYQWANVSGNYSSPEDYIELCTKCHALYDYRKEH